jgi:hypothetical protein
MGLPNAQMQGVFSTKAFIYLKNKFYEKAYLLLRPMYGACLPEYLWQFGIHSGGVFSDMNVTGVGQDYDSNLKPGFFAGLFFRKNFTPSIAVQPEFNWVQKGAITKLEEEKLRINLNYLEVPVYFLYTSPTGKAFLVG